MIYENSMKILLHNKGITTKNYLGTQLYFAVRFVVALFGVAHFGADLFGTNFMKIIFFF